MHIATAAEQDVDDWAALRHALWPEGSIAEHAAEAWAMLDDGNAIALVARDDAGAAIGFAEAALRHDYVNGCETSPVLFLEGIFVAPEARRQGIARALIDRVAQWGRMRGCREFASDAALDNAASHALHATLGFAETERVVYFRQTL
jgi:aminoglycoside 6'-N-acetyltransferase I